MMQSQGSKAQPVQSSLRDSGGIGRHVLPAMNRWAICMRPSGASEARPTRLETWRKRSGIAKLAWPPVQGRVNHLLQSTRWGIDSVWATAGGVAPACLSCLKHGRAAPGHATRLGMRAGSEDPRNVR